MKLEAAKKLLDKQVELIKNTSNFYEANCWLSGCISCITELDKLTNEEEFKALLDYKSKLLWENFE